MPADDRWRPRDSGPVVRPYAVTGGRTEPADGASLDLLTMVVAARQLPDAADGQHREQHPERTPEHRRILAACRRRTTVADVAADVSLPLGVVRVLLADLIQDGSVSVVRQRPVGEQASNDTLQEILNGLRAL